MNFVLLTLGAIGHVIFWVALVNRTHGLGIARRHVDALTIACAVGCAGLPLLVLGSLWTKGVAFPPQDWTPTLLAVWGYVMGSAMFCVSAILRRLRLQFHPERVGSQLTNHTAVANIRQRVAGPLAAPGYPAICAALPGNQVFELHIHEKELAIPRLSPEHSGIRLAHVSDLHMSGRIDKPYFVEVVKEVNRWEPDLIAITGDIVERPECLDWIPDTIAQLQAENGVYFVLGNHDKKAGANQLRQRLIEAGLKNLGGKTLVTEVRGTPLLLAGNEQPWFGPLPEMATAVRDEQGLPLRILLAHTPDQFRWAQENDFDLMLAGHIHGGQVQFPIVGAVLAPSLHGTRYPCGVFRQGNTVMHVSRGSGSLAPFRFNCPPEISLLTLRSD